MQLAVSGLPIMIQIESRLKVFPHRWLILEELCEADDLLVVAVAKAYRSCLRTSNAMSCSRLKLAVIVAGLFVWDQSAMR